MGMKRILLKKKKRARKIFAKCLAKAKCCRDLLSRTCLDLEQAMTMADKAKRLTVLSRKEAQQALWRK